MTDLRDKIYRETLDELAQFAFDDSVARVFPDMIKRSVPGYTTIIAMTGLLAEKYALPGSNLYDLGCSLGASSLAMRQQVKQQDCQLIAIDSSAAMLDRCQTIINTDAHELPVKMVCADITDVAITDASVVVLNFTLQFIAVEQRDQVIERIYKGLRPGGIMILSEKVSFEDSHLDELNIDLHHQFKRANGYSDLEIAQKRDALEDFLLPETLRQHKQRISAAGFSSCDVWFQCFNFASLVALK
ncbi:MAG: tRNA (cmo5U34)-methyltransferase [Halioglobus sp.]